MLVIIIHITKNKMWHNGITIPINTFGRELGIKPHVYSFGKIIIYNYYAQIIEVTFTIIAIFLLLSLTSWVRLINLPWVFNVHLTTYPAGLGSLTNS